MFEKIIVILLILCAIAGMFYSVHTQRHRPCEGDGTCKDCPLSPSCKKKKDRR